MPHHLSAVVMNTPTRHFYRLTIIINERVLTFDELAPDDIVLFKQHVPAPIELHLVLVSLVVEAIETCVPETLTIIANYKYSLIL